MKRCFPFLFCFSFLLPSLILPFASKGQTTCQLAYQLIKTAEKYHYAPRPVDDTYSQLLFDEFIHTLDPAAIIFTTDDIKQLKIQAGQLDEQILEQRCDFLEQATVLYEQKLRDALILITGIEEGPLDLQAADTLKAYKDQQFVPRNQLRQRWEKLIKFQLLSAHLLSSDSALKKDPPTLEAIQKLKTDIIRRYHCHLNSKLDNPGGLKEQVGDKFLKAVSFAFDPHTEYFGATEKNEYETMLSKDAKGYGLEFTDNELGEIEIYLIIPGSPAWNSNALNEGDVILSVETPDSISKDFSCINLSEAYQFISDPSLNEAFFEIRKKNGERLRIKLFKEQIDVEENVIRSFILEGDRKIGYIYLPSFYTQMSSLHYLPNGCANDLAKEIIKLKRENIEGLVFDLRNNGGGSMLEALRVAGIFINYGAVSIIEKRDRQQETLKDPDRGTVFNKPLLVLINKYSASASELFAAAMQDYHRAVIAGSNSFGKSTAQEFLPIDAGHYDNPSFASKKTFVKLTEGAFFRVTGATHQKTGVEPDIRLPDPDDRPEMGEGQFASALDFAAIDKKTYYYPLAPLPIDTLQAQSQARLAKNETFNKIRESMEAAMEEGLLFAIPLSFEAFRDYFTSVTGDDPLPESEEKDVFSVKNPSYMEGISNFNNSKEEVNQQAMKEIREDVYIRESFFILNDLIHLQSN